MVTKLAQELKTSFELSVPVQWQGTGAWVPAQNYNGFVRLNRYGGHDQIKLGENPKEGVAVIEGVQYIARRTTEGYSDKLTAWGWYTTPAYNRLKLIWGGDKPLPNTLLLVSGDQTRLFEYNSSAATPRGTTPLYDFVSAVPVLSDLAYKVQNAEEATHHEIPVFGFGLIFFIRVNRFDHEPKGGYVQVERAHRSVTLDYDVGNTDFNHVFRTLFKGFYK